MLPGTLIEDRLDRHARIGAAQHDGERALAAARSSATRGPYGSDCGVPATKRALPALEQIERFGGIVTRPDRVQAAASRSRSACIPRRCCGSVTDGSKDRSRPQGLNLDYRGRRLEVFPASPLRRCEASNEAPSTGRFSFHRRVAFDGSRIACRPHVKKPPSESSPRSSPARRTSFLPIMRAYRRGNHQAARRAAQGRQHLLGRQEHALPDRRGRSRRRNWRAFLPDRPESSSPGVDPVAPAKALKTFSDTVKRIAVKAAYIDGKIVDARQVENARQAPAENRTHRQSRRHARQSASRARHRALGKSERPRARARRIREQKAGAASNA